MSDSVEMFLRQVIVDEQLPFPVRAPSESKLAAIGEVYTEEPTKRSSGKGSRTLEQQRSLRRKSKGG